MPAYKNKDNGTWYVMTQYTNWKGERKPKCKRRFDTKREAQEWEHTFRQQNSGDLDMPFSVFVEIYCQEQKPRLKESTWQTKENIIQQKILPYFENQITTKDVRAWQNEMLAYRNEDNKPYSSSYLKTLHNQLSAIFNYAVRFYDLRSNTAAKARNMGSEERKEILFWTKEEYQKFSEVMMDRILLRANQQSQFSTLFARYFKAVDSYHRLNITNGNLYRENEMLSKINSKLKNENENLRSEVKDYKLLRKVFGHKQIDELLEQARNIKGHKREKPRSR